MHFSAQDCLCQLRFSSPRRFLSHVVHITWKVFCHSCNQMKNTLIQLTEKPVLLIQFLHPKASNFVIICCTQKPVIFYNYSTQEPVILLKLLHPKVSNFVIICCTQKPVIFLQLLHPKASHFVTITAPESQ